MSFSGKHYGYDHPSGRLVYGFLYLWSGIWLGCCLYSFSQPVVSINDRQVPIREATPFLLGMTAIGCVVLTLGLALHSFHARSRIELGPDSIRWYDWLGRLRVEAPLSSLLGRSEKAVESSHGSIRYYDQLRYRDEFEKRIDRWLAAKTVHLPSDAPRTVRGFEDRRVFRNHQFGLLAGGLVWNAFLLAALVGIWTRFFDNVISLNDQIFMTCGIALFMVPGAWMLGSFFLERIEIGDNHIRWIDWRGNRRVEAPLGEVRGLSDYHGEDSRSFTIATDRGDIGFSSSMPGSDELIDILRRALET